MPISREDIFSLPFPIRLHWMLSLAEEEGYSRICSWKPHGRAFQVHKKDEFEESILPRYFNHNRFTSFQRQLNHYCFIRISVRAEHDPGAYYHERFLRGRLDLAAAIAKAKKILGAAKGTKLSYPNFYSMDPVVAPSFVADDRTQLDTIHPPATTLLTRANHSEAEQRRNEPPADRVTVGATDLDRKIDNCLRQSQPLEKYKPTTSNDQTFRLLGKTDKGKDVSRTSWSFGASSVYQSAWSPKQEMVYRSDLSPMGIHEGENGKLDQEENDFQEIFSTRELADMVRFLGDVDLESSEDEGYS